MSLVDTNWLEKNINRVKIIDCSWHMPSENRNPEKEFKEEHIPNAIFFDLDKNSKQDTDLPHMLPKEDAWNKIVSRLGILKNDQIIVYDNSNVNSACRCWYNFIYFGHDPKLVSVLDGGFKKWKKENKQITNKIINFSKSNYLSKEINTLVKDKNKTEKILNVSKNDAFKQYIAYHEGWGNYKNYKNNKKVIGLANKVENQSNIYKKQLSNCRNSLSTNKYIIF